MSEPLLIADHLLDTYCPHRVRGGEQFCIFCLRKLWDDAVAERDAMRSSIAAELRSYADTECGPSDTAYSAVMAAADQIDRGGQ
jgi:hypothetical protein